MKTNENAVLKEEIKLLREEMANLQGRVQQLDDDNINLRTQLSATSNAHRNDSRQPSTVP